MSAKSTKKDDCNAKCVAILSGNLIGTFEEPNVERNYIIYEVRGRKNNPYGKGTVAVSVAVLVDEFFAFS